MTFSWEDLIKRARVYKDDDHDDEDAWISTESWMTLFQVEYGLLYPRWLRSGVFRPEYTETALAAGTVDLEGVCAIIGVAEVLDNGQYRVLEPAPQFQAFRGTDTGKALYWEVSGAADDLTVTVYPTDTSGSYVVRHIALPAYETDPAEEVDLPFGGDERLVLGAADRAGIKDATVSRKLMELKRDSDVALNFLAFGRGDGPMVRRVNRTPFTSSWQTNPMYWRYM